MAGPRMRSGPSSRFPLVVWHCPNLGSEVREQTPRRCFSNISRTTSRDEGAPTRAVLQPQKEPREQARTGYEDAIREAVERASSTIRNITSVWVKEFEAVVENNQVTQFRVVVKIAFIMDEGAGAG